MPVNIPSQIVVKTAAQWAVDATVYSAKRILITSDVLITGSDQRKIKISNGVDTWANLDYFLGNVDNTSDANKPVSTAQQTALNLKSNIASPTFTGTVTTPAIIVSSETANTIAQIDANKNVKSLGTAIYPSLTELSYGKGVTSSIQTQLNLLPFWITIPGTPVRVGSTSFTITDTANANLYNLLLSRLTVIKWTDTGVTKQAMIVSATYASNDVTITIIGDTLAASATMNTFKYSVEKATQRQLVIAGTMAVGNNLTNKFFAKLPLKVFGVDGNHGTAGTTNATTYSVSKNQEDGSGGILAADLSIASGATAGDGYTATDGTTMALDDYLVANCTAVSTTAPIDAYITFFVAPLYNQYLN